jgi:hypothetical protein
VHSCGEVTHHVRVACLVHHPSVLQLDVQVLRAATPSARVKGQRFQPPLKPLPLNPPSQWQWSPSLNYAHLTLLWLARTWSTECNMPVMARSFLSSTVTYSPPQAPSIRVATFNHACGLLAH